MSPLPAEQSKANLSGFHMDAFVPALLQRAGPNPEVVLACNMLKTAFTAGNHRVAACLGQFT